MLHNVMAAHSRPKAVPTRPRCGFALSAREAAKGDAGVTVVEMMVASFLLGLGVLGVTALLVSSARTAAIAEAQNDASALATGELEIVRSYNYELVGIDPSSDGYAAEVDDRPTVTERDGNLVDATEKVELDDTVYLIERSVTWATVGSNREAYKIVRIVVSWDTNVGVRSLTVQTGLHEGLFGV